jgi:hypothetical protein
MTVNRILEPARPCFASFKSGEGIASRLHPDASHPNNTAPNGSRSRSQPPNPKTDRQTDSCLVCPCRTGNSDPCLATIHRKFGPCLATTKKFGPCLATKRKILISSVMGAPVVALLIAAQALGEDGVDARVVCDQLRVPPLEHEELGGPAPGGALERRPRHALQPRLGHRQLGQPTG